MKRQSIASRLPKLHTVAFAPLTFLLGMPLAYAASNLGLTNGTFDVETKPWVIVGKGTSGSTGPTACGATKCLELKIDNATVTATSEGKKNVSPGEFVTASAMVKRSSVTEPDNVSLGIVFYGDGNVPIGTTTWSNATGPADTWGNVKVSAIAPAGTLATVVVVRGKSTGKVSAHVDNVVLSKIVFEDKGPQVSLARVSAAAFDSKKNALYVAANGNPAKFFHYSVENGKAEIVKKTTWDYNVDIWSLIVGGDGAAYFGTASGKLYKYDSAKNADPVELMEFKKEKSGSRTIWSLKAGADNCIYGGLEPDGTSTGGFKYCSNPEKLTMLPLPTADAATQVGYQVRSLAIDPGANTTPGAVYWGMGVNSRLHKSTLDGSRTSNNLLDGVDADHEYAYYTDFVKDRLFVRLTGTDFNQTVVLDRDGRKIGNSTVAGINSIGMSPLSTDDHSAICKNAVFYTKNLGDTGLKKGTHLSSYCFDKGIETNLLIQMGPAAAFASTPALAPTQLFSVLRETAGGKGKIERFNLADLHNSISKKTLDPIEFDAPTTASEIRTFVVRNGTTYSSGYVNGDLGISDGKGNPPVLVKEPLQAEGMAILGDHLYIGGYQDAVLKSYELTPDGLGKVVMKNDDTLGTKYGQNRPFAMLALPAKSKSELDRLVIATVPKKLEQGALAVYSVGERDPWKVVKEPFNGQSILALTRIDNVVYGGTSVWREKDETPSPGFAKLFTFDPFKTFAITKVDFTGDIVNEENWTKKAITALLTVNRHIWVLAEDTIVIYDHDTQTVVNKLRINPHFSYAAWPVAWNAGSMVESNGYVYFSANDTFGTNVYRVNIGKPESIELVRKGEAGMLRVDANGDIYFINGAKVMKFNPAL
ncbi:hypothetical protein [Massilia sp. CCM 8734]|uniref:hypothetical protein n=1 Tax=Massilia sp. CCM 8734 TaxID=2609283 RepID=UPI00141D7E4C|nr:hypothetical protein [Massilia sp. CCM 8734]NIA00392.1 hypothetical protein [Massilia sp. CCM 8734]